VKRLRGRKGCEQRNRIRRRDNGICQKCGQLGHEVDHKIALEDQGTNDDANLWLLCRECHKTKTHGFKGCDVDGNPTGGWKA
jgi:5-methylcytosine-specific restriction protein A